MDQQKKKAIRQNMMNLRLSIKQKCTEKNEQGATVWKTKNNDQEAPCIRRRRKTSENLKSFQSLSVFRDQSISQRFEQFFQLQEKLGEGVQSVVYKCREFGTDQIYAVKVVKQKDLELMYNLRQCYEILKQLDHESIISGRYLYMNQKKLTCHMIMEMVEYPDLRAFIQEKKERDEKISETTVANIIKCLLQCLVYMGEKGVCHRDIKPENILYDPVTGRLKLIDFETARMQRYSHQKLQLWSCTGTPCYRAPETYSRSYGIPVDTWAVGMVAFEMLTGKLPFKTQYLATTVKKICERQIKFDDYDLSPLAKSFLKKLLDKNPQTRIVPKQAVSHPFILKNTEFAFRRSLRKKGSFKKEEDRDSQETEHGTPTNYYQEDMHFSLSENLAKDIGVRFCQQ